MGPKYILEAIMQQYLSGKDNDDIICTDNRDDFLDGTSHHIHGLLLLLSVSEYISGFFLLTLTPDF